MRQMRKWVSRRMRKMKGLEGEEHIFLVRMLISIFGVFFLPLALCFGLSSGSQRGYMDCKRIFIGYL